MKNLLWMAIALLLAISCAKEENEYAPVPSRYIGYSVDMNSSSDAIMTKGGALLGRNRTLDISIIEGKLAGKDMFMHTSIGDWIGEDVSTKGEIIYTNTISNMGISAWYYGLESEYSSGQCYFANDEIGLSYVEDDKLSVGVTDRFWPHEQKDKNMMFYAYSPIDAQSGEKPDEGEPALVSLPDFGEWEDGIASFDYVVPSEVMEQSDLLVAAKNVPGDKFKGGNVELEFKHALTAVQFEVDESLYDLRIDVITISGVKGSGTYTYKWNTDEEVEDGSWDISMEEADVSYILDFSSGGGILCDGNAKILNTGKLILFMLPQDLGTDAKVVVNGYDVANDKAVVLEGKIGGEGKVWEKGKQVIYRISDKSVDVTYVFNVEDVTIVSNTPGATVVTDSKVVPYYGQIGRKYIVESYKQVTKMGETEFIALPWFIGESNTYEEEINTDPNKEIKTSHWIDFVSKTEGPGGVYSDDENNENRGTYNVISIEPSKEQGISHTRMWNKQLKGSSEEAYNLAGSGNSLTTANCYIVDAPGYYKLPLVYGNALLNGAENVNSYKVRDGITSGRVFDANLTTGETVSLTVNVLSPFVNYKGEGISSPWISQDTGIPVGEMAAEVVWQDEPCVITEAYIKDNYLHFRVREDCVCEGNAVVAVKHIGEKEFERGEDGTASVETNRDIIMWSWHIWITDNNPLGNPVGITNRIAANKDEDDNPIFTQNTFNIMKTPLGYSHHESKLYTERKGQIVFFQKDNGEVVNKEILDVNQGSFKVNDQGKRDTIVSPPANVVYYQYGRKDPLHPAYAVYDNDNIVGTNNKPYYSELREQFTQGYGGGRVGTHENQENEKVIKIKDGIIRPGRMYAKKVVVAPGLTSNNGVPLEYNHWITNSDSDWNVFNLWNTNSNILPMFVYNDVFVYNTETEAFDKLVNSYDVFGNLKELIDLGVTKTIYDPSPVGYEMPRIDAFAGFTYEGLNYAGWGYYTNVENWGSPSYEDGVLGYNFYRRPLLSVGNEDCFDKVSGTVFLGAFGYRNDLTGSLETRNNNNSTESSYGRYGNALTSAPVCIQWPNQPVGEETDGNYFSLQLARFCYDSATKNFRPISGSNLSMAFPVIPVQTGANPLPQNNN